MWLLKVDMELLVFEYFKTDVFFVFFSTSTEHTYDIFMYVYLTSKNSSLITYKQYQYSNQNVPHHTVIFQSYIIMNDGLYWMAECKCG